MNARRHPTALLALSFALAAAACSTGGHHGSPDTRLVAAAARPADAFADSVGVNVHLTYTNTPYADTSRVLAALQAAGIRHVRDGMVPGRQDELRDIALLGRAGLTFDLIMGAPEREDAPLSRLMQMADQVAPYVDALEGANEYDDTRRPDWAALDIGWQEALWRSVRADPLFAGVKVVGPSLVFLSSRGRLGDLTPYLDVGNIHSYPGGFEPNHNLELNLSLAALNAGTKPTWATETGYHNAIDERGGQPAVSETAAAYYLPSLLLDYFARGIQRTYLYELIDLLPEPAATQAGDHWGLLRNDWTPKPSFEVVSALIKALADPGPSFTPGTLEMALDTGSGVHRLVFQRRDGTFQVVLWLDARLPDGTAPDATADVGDQRATVSFIPAAGVPCPRSCTAASSAPTGPTETVTAEVGAVPVVIDVPPVSAGSAVRAHVQPLAVRTGSSPIADAAPGG